VRKILVLALAYGLLWVPYRLWEHRAKIWESVWHAAVFSSVWLMTSKLFKAAGWL